MTTTVYDAKLGLLTSDSRWSKTTEFGCIYVDDTGFDKIHTHKNAVYQFAGDSLVIQQWKDFLRSDPSSSKGRPTQNGIALLIVDVPTRSVLHVSPMHLQIRSAVSTDAYFSGSGQFYAVPAWKMTNCPKFAVEIAKSGDLYSGGETKFFELSNQTHNLNLDGRLADISKALLEKGYVMYNAKDQSTPSMQPITFKEAAAKDPQVAAFQKAVTGGQIYLEAPCAELYVQPTQEQDEALDQALDNILSR